MLEWVKEKEVKKVRDELDELETRKATDLYEHMAKSTEFKAMAF